MIDLLRNRRSIRRFTGQPVEQDKIDLLLEAALRSPSSKGNTPWQFMVVQDRQRLNQLAVAKTHGAAFLKNAPLAIVICADPSQSDVWVEDASIATTLIHLEATDLGLGSCWVQIRLRQREDQSSSQEYLADLLGRGHRHVHVRRIPLKRIGDQNDLHSFILRKLQRRNQPLR